MKVIKYQIRLYSRGNKPVWVVDTEKAAIGFAANKFPNTNHYVVKVTEELVHVYDPKA